MVAFERDPATIPMNATNSNGHISADTGIAAATNNSPTEEGRSWLFPGVDEYFRGIYTRAGLGYSKEIMAVCSSIAGEGKTTLCVGLGITLAQDFPDTRVLIVETDVDN